MYVLSCFVLPPFVGRLIPPPSVCLFLSQTRYAIAAPSHSFLQIGPVELRGEMERIKIRSGCLASPWMDTFRSGGKGSAAPVLTQWSMLETKKIIKLIGP